MGCIRSRRRPVLVLSRASFFLKAIALLVFLGGIAAATYGVQNVIAPAGSPSVAAASSLRIDAVHPLVNATPGHDVTFYVVVTNRGEVARTLVANVSGDGIAGSAPEAIVPAASNETFLVTLSLPKDITVGTHNLRATISTPDGSITRTRSDLLTLRILPPLPGYDATSKATAIYAGRLAASGKVFNTNDAALTATNFPKTDSFQPSSGELPLSAATSLVEGFIDGVTGMQAGESRTFTFGPDKGYGNATTTRDLPRVEPIDRAFPLRVHRPPADRASFDSFINGTQQGDPRTYRAGDLFHSAPGVNTLPYRIVSINATTVVYELAAKVGDEFTIFPFWPNASKVVSVNETTALTLTTPTSAPGENFTYYAYWPGMTQLASYNDTTILVKHTPPVGFKFTLPQTQAQPATDARVHDVTADSIVISVPSNNPLAGQYLTFDVYFTSLTK